MIVKVLSSKEYSNKNNNCGDCFIIDDGKQLVVFDCGCEEHANRVIQYMDAKGYASAIFVLSHNDDDHFNGITTLIEQSRVSRIITILLLKYVPEIFKRIDDKRKNKKSLKRQIMERYDNISSLSKKVTLENIYTEDGKYIKITDHISIVGPDLDYMLDAVSKLLDTTEGDTIDGETIINATSVQLKIEFSKDNMLLCGDACFESIKTILPQFSIIQLPHHGKKDTAEAIFDLKFGQNNTLYVISDNTGNSNGGSDNLNTTVYKGHNIRNTKKHGDILIDEFSSSYTPKYTGSYSLSRR